MGISASGRVIVKQLASTDILHLYKISATSLAFLMAFIGHASASSRVLPKAQSKLGSKPMEASHSAYTVQKDRLKRKLAS